MRIAVLFYMKINNKKIITGKLDSPFWEISQWQGGGSKVAKAIWFVPMRMRSIVRSSRDYLSSVIIMLVYT
jgi:hypothetical protein